MGFFSKYLKNKKNLPGPVDIYIKILSDSSKECKEWKRSDSQKHFMIENVCIHARVMGICGV